MKNEKNNLKRVNLELLKKYKRVTGSVDSVIIKRFAMTKNQKQKTSIYLIKLNINNKKKLKYRFSSFEEACTFFYCNLNLIVRKNTNKSYAYCNACLYYIHGNKNKLLIRKNLTKVIF